MVSGVGKSEPHEPCGIQPFLEFPPNLSDFPPNLDIWMRKLETTWKISSAYTVNKVTMYIINQGHVNIMQHLSKGRQNTILVKFMFYAVLSPFQICCNLLAFSPSSTWSSSILPSPSLPLKPISTLCHPLAQM